MNDFSPYSDMAVWDWYKTSIRLKDNDWKDFIAPELFKQWPDHYAEDCPPNRPFEKGRHLVDAESNERLLLICSGGDHVSGITQFQSTGVNSPALAAALLASGVAHEPTRVDAAIDWFEDGLFDTLAHAFKIYAKDHRLSISTPGDWVRGEGRTLYIGSRNSPLFVRLYEKGYEQRKKGDFKAPLNWVRFEVEVKYKKDYQKKVLSTLSPSDCFRLGWVAGLCETIMFNEARIPMPSVYKAPTNDDKRVKWLVKQYGSAIQGLIDSKGSPEAMGVYLAQLIAAA